MFGETEIPKIFFIFQGTELSYDSGKVYSEPWHVYDFVIFKALAYLELKAYSEL